MSPLNDIDVIYFDKAHLSWDIDEAYESKLRSIVNRYNWSVKNQARMHIRNKHLPYESIDEALREWPEVCTAVAMRLNADNSWTVIAPHGLEDLFSLIIRKSPSFTDRDYFLNRIDRKGWTNRWSKLKIVEG
jgi:uncharacterized protein